MKSTGVVRKIDDLGRVVIPSELRKTLGIDIKDGLEIYTEDNKIILKKYIPGCDACESMEEVQIIGRVKMCGACAAKLFAKHAANTIEGSK